MKFSGNRSEMAYFLEMVLGSLTRGGASDLPSMATLPRILLPKERGARKEWREGGTIKNKQNEEERAHAKSVLFLFRHWTDSAHPSGLSKRI